MADYFANAFVRLKPDPTGFREALRAQIKSSLVGLTAKVPLIVEPTAFRQKLLQATSKPVPIKIIPADVAAFRTALEEQLALKPLVVPVVPAATGAAGAAGVAGLAGAPAGRGAGTTTTTVTRVSPAERAALEIDVQRRTIQRELAAAMLLTAGSEEKLAALDAVLTKGEKSLAANAVDADKAFVQGNRDLERTITRRNELLRSDVRLIASERERTATVVQGAREQAAAAEKSARDQIAANTAATRSAARNARENLAQQKLLARGAGATGLSILGVRGATLAASASFLIGAAAAASFAKAIQATAQLQTQLNVFQATTHATAQQMEAVRAAAVALGNDITLPAVGAKDAATAMVELAKAGLSVSDSIAGARGVLQLATAANIDIAAAVELAANALNAFQLSGSEAVHVADVLANAANAAQGSITDMGQALAQTAAVGHQVGLTFEDTTTFITDMAKSGIRGSDAGTSLRVALLRIVNPTKQAGEEFKKLGISVRDAQGNLRPEFFLELGAALRNVSKAQRDATLALIGGQDAVRALSVLTRQSLPEFLATRAALRQQGTAADVASARTKGLAGAAEQLKNTLATVGLSAQALSPALQTFVLGLNAGIQGFASSAVVAGTLHQSLQLVATGFHIVGSAAAIAGPPVLALANAFGTLALNIGAPALLAGFVAFKAFAGSGRLTAALLGGMLATTRGVTALTAAFGGARVASAEFAASVAIGGPLRAGLGALSAGLVGLRAGLVAAGTALTGFLTSATGIGLVAAVAAGGLFFLLTRESTLERETKALTKATDEYASALGRAHDAAQTLAGAERTLAEDRLRVQQASLANDQAQRALASSTAPRGSFERRQLEIQAATAAQNLKFAEQDLTQALKDQKLAIDDNKAAQSANNQAREKAIKSTQDLLNTESERAKAFRGAGIDKFAADALREFTEALRKQAREDKLSTDSFTRDLGKRKQLLADLAAFIKKFPSEKRVALILDTRIPIRTEIDQISQLFAQAGFKSADAFRDFLLRRLGMVPGEVDHTIRMGALRAEGTGIQAYGAAGEAVAKSFWEKFGAAFTQGANRVTALSNQLILQQARGASLQSQLQTALAEQAQAQRNLDRINARIAAAGGRMGPALRAQRQKAIQDLSKAASDVASIQGQIASNAQAAQQKIAQARNKADQAILNMFGRQEARATLNQAHIEATASLKDDIALANSLVTLYKNQLRIARKKLKDSQTQTQAIADLTRKLKDEQQKRRDLLKQEADAEKAAAQARRDRQEEILNLNVQIAQTTGNKRAEQRALEAEIKFYERQIRNAKGNELLRKQYILKLRQAQKDLKDLKNEISKTGDTFRAMAFEFLTTQEGFAATLLGNLLPLGALGGTVGGTAAPSTGLASTGTPPGRLPPLPHGAAVATGPGGPLPNRVIEEAGKKAAARERGASFTQTQRIIGILQSVVHQLEILNQRAGHPEAKHHQATNSAHVQTRGF